MKSNPFKVLVAVLVLAVTIFSGAVAAQTGARTYVFINGSELTSQELYLTQQQLGTRIAPGNYIYNANSGCWAELTSGQRGCLGNGGGGSYTSRYGSGEWNGNGDWNHWSNAAGGAVGGTGDGCLYTSFGWSNC